ncbi:MAG: hypothetical protein ACK5C4_14110 [Pseudanabaena sp.]
MKKQSHLVSGQISPEDWDNTPTSVKQLVDALTANVSLLISESRLLQFLDATPMGIAVYDATGQLIYINNLSTGQKFNGVEESLGIEMKVNDEVTQEIKTTTKNAFR